MPRPGFPSRPGSTVIPANWGTQHAPVAVGTMTARCQIRHPSTGAPTYDPETKTSTAASNPPHYDGLCRLQVLSVEDRTRLFAEQELTTQGYLVTTTMTNDETKVDDIVKVTECTDETFVTRELVVQSVSRGSLIWERDLVAIDNLG